MQIFAFMINGLGGQWAKERKDTHLHRAGVRANPFLRRSRAVRGNAFSVVGFCEHEISGRNVCLCMGWWCDML